MKFFKSISSLLLVLGLCSTAIMAQLPTQGNAAAPDSVTDTEIRQFIETANEMQKIQQNLQQKIFGVLQEENMEPQRFQRIMQSRQNPQAQNSVDITDEEQKIIDKIEPQLQTMSQEAQQQQLQVIQNSELEQQRFQQIAMALQTDQALAQRFQKMAMEMQQEGNQ